MEVGLVPDELLEELGGPLLRLVDGHRFPLRNECNRSALSTTAWRESGRAA
jgi:hypothetical protein